ncbi:hypothetical protein Q7P37_000234 [Cladosporium fusiforme]
MPPQEQKKSGKPRLDATERLRHRFYEPLLLLQILNPRRNDTAGQPTMLFTTRNFIASWRKFLDALAWFGDYHHGGESVCAIAARPNPSGVEFWVAATHQRSETLVKIIIEQLSRISDDLAYSTGLADAIADQFLRSNTDKARSYVSSIKRLLKLANQAKLPTLDDETQTVTREIESILSSPQDIVATSQALQTLERKNELDTLVRAEDSIRDHSNWAKVRHYVGRMSMWHRKAKILVDFAAAQPQLFASAVCVYLKLPKAVMLPEADAKTNLASALKRMLPATEQHHASLLYEGLMTLRDFDFEEKFIRPYNDRKSNIRVHAELFLAEHFWLNKLGLYLRYHPGNLVVRPSHGNVWPRWCPPLMAGTTNESHAKHNLDVMNKVIAHIRRDVLNEIEMRLPRWQRIPDSSSANSTQNEMHDGFTWL